MIFPEELTIRDVTLRDGLQNESIFVETDEKVKWIDRLLDAGFVRLEVTSFVHPKWIPALRDADELAQRLPARPGVEYEALVPNRRGWERFVNTNIHNAIFVLSASTRHNQANLNRTTDESLAEVVQLAGEAVRQGRKVMGGIATAFVCPYAGVVPYREVERIAERLVASGVNEIGLADTIGKATPRMVYEYCSRLRERFPDVSISLHLHDTYGYGLANVLAGIQAGARLFDVAQAGLGGCPYAPGAPGNVRASQVIQFLERQGIKTGLAIEKIRKLDEDFSRLLRAKKAAR
ncbi:hydroxymethylglutaryl-CoA lyase [Brevibacillus marinus]|uniref:hydroxymethylglutaryl-CoA lyase n=1 Tax=Brevibacillus marinus TaxID=2496837 RepID=UPI001F49C080|nr:hydroxymethylglutaryl-CoA lyase [Brevibacillus marinus]